MIQNSLTIHHSILQHIPIYYLHSTALYICLQLLSPWISTQKRPSRKARDQKNVAWTEIKSALLFKCGKDFDKEQLQKKWSNRQEKKKGSRTSSASQRNQTVGGNSADLKQETTSPSGSSARPTIY